MEKLFAFIFICFFLNGFMLSAQNKDYAVFRKAITELNTEYQAKKSQAMVKYENSKKIVEAQRQQEPTVAVFGGNEKENDQIKNAVEEAINPSKNVDSGKEKESKGKKSAQDNIISFDFKSIPMFPNEASGRIFQPYSKVNKESTQEAISLNDFEWSDVSVSTEEILIDDIKDPAEKKKWKEIATLQADVFEVEQINFIDAIFKETATEQGFNKMLADLKPKGYSFDNEFKNMTALDQQEKIEYMKAAILSLISKILNK